MPQSNTANRRIVLNARPVGAPTANDFRVETADVPVPGAGQVLLRTVWLSLDPYMRGRMSDAPSYAPPVALGDVMVGGTVSRVVASNLPAYREGIWSSRAAAGRTMRCPTAAISSRSAATSRIRHMRSACSACRASPRTRGC